MQLMRDESRHCRQIEIKAIECYGQVRGRGVFDFSWSAFLRWSAFHLCFTDPSAVSARWRMADPCPVAVGTAGHHLAGTRSIGLKHVHHPHLALKGRRAQPDPRTSLRTRQDRRQAGLWTNPQPLSSAIAHPKPPQCRHIWHTWSVWAIAHPRPSVRPPRVDKWASCRKLLLRQCIWHPKTSQ